MENIVDNVLIVKVGTNTLIQKQADGSEQLDQSSFDRLGCQIIQQKEAGRNIVIVSSAAITAGMVATSMAVRPNHMGNLQRLASIGWRHVLNAWDIALDGITIGELLLTRHDLELTAEHDEALRTTHQLILHGDIAIVNENDAISHEQIAFGDNDTLAATLAAKIKQSALFGHAVELMLLSDVDGVYEDVNDCDTRIRVIDNLTKYKHLAVDTDKANGTGGMTTKFEAARIATQHGVAMFIANGRQDNVLQKALSGQAGTAFV